MLETITDNGQEEVYGEGMKSSNDDDHDPEKYPESNDCRSIIHDIKLDADGLPLVPQPSRFKDDPLVRPFPNADSYLSLCRLPGLS
jgi:hypothetical protein